MTKIPTVIVAAAAVVVVFTAGLAVGRTGFAFAAPPRAGLEVSDLHAGAGAALPQEPEATMPGMDAPASGIASGMAALGLLAVTGVLARQALAGARQPTSGMQVQPSERHIVSLAAFESELGVQEPVGFWDPLGFSADGDVAAFKRRRSVEIKHGRICMLATMGYITPEITGKLPGYLSPSAGLKFEDIPNGLAAISKVPVVGWAQIAAYFGFCEFSGGFEDYKSGTPGDYGFNVLTSDDPAEKTKKLSAEIANGRLAMVAIIGMFFQDGLTGSAWGDWALYTASPLRSFEGELGVQAPVGFWDPLGFTKDGDVVQFKKRRAVELKHGRLSMLACMGYMTPEITGKFPGYLSPSMDIKFADVPNGLKALSAVPAIGWAQIIGYCFVIEVRGLSDDYATCTPGDYGFKVLTSADPEKKKAKLNAELANGRLAMVAIIGMFYQDGLTGSPWGDWALYTDSPLRAFETEIGVQAPVGFWDPMGLSKDGDVESFKRRRVTEIKHGRVAMWAMLGYITPEYFKWPGYCSPSLGLKFSEIPNGLGALSKVPGAGWTQIFLFCGLIEKGVFVYDPSRAPGDYENGGVLGVPNGSTLPAGEAKTRKLNAELANGRLAMMAIIGMFYQDGLTGSAWGDWSLYTDSPLR